MARLAEVVVETVPALEHLASMEAVAVVHVHSPAVVRTEAVVVVAGYDREVEEEEHSSGLVERELELDAEAGSEAGLVARDLALE